MNASTCASTRELDQETLKCFESLRQLFQNLLFASPSTGAKWNEFKIAAKTLTLCFCWAGSDGFMLRKCVRINLYSFQLNLVHSDPTHAMAAWNQTKTEISLLPMDLEALNLEVAGPHSFFPYPLSHALLLYPCSPHRWRC